MRTQDSSSTYLFMPKKAKINEIIFEATIASFKNLIINSSFMSLPSGNRNPEKREEEEDDDEEMVSSFVFIVYSRGGFSLSFVCGS